MNIYQAAERLDHRLKIVAIGAVIFYALCIWEFSVGIVLIAKWRKLANNLPLTWAAAGACADDLEAALAAHDQKVRAEALEEAARVISGSCKDNESETDEALTWAASRIRLFAETGK